MQLTALSTTQCSALGVQAAARRPAAAAAPLRPAAAAAALHRRQRPAAGSSSSSSGRGRLVVTAAVKVQKGKQILCSKTMKAKEGHEEQLRQLCQGVADFSRQRMPDRSAGVLAFEVSEVSGAEGCGGSFRRGCHCAIVRTGFPRAVPGHPDHADQHAGCTLPRPPAPALAISWLL